MSQPTAFTQSLHLPKANSTPKALQPMPFWLSVALFGVPALVMVLSIYLFIPWLRSLGIPEIESFLAAHIIPMALIFTAAFVALYRVEGYPQTWQSLSERYRFPRLRIKHILWALVIYAALMIGYGITSQVGMALILNGVIPIPSGLNQFLNPRFPLIGQLTGGMLRGNWGIAALWAVMLFFNIAGEELWWRGYILPRQELTHGKWTWLIHGLMWLFFHAFKYWELPGLLPVCLIISFCAQRMKNNWPVFIAHLIFNGMALVIVLAAVAGMI